MNILLHTSYIEESFIILVPYEWVETVDILVEEIIKGAGLNLASPAPYIEA